MLLGTLQIFTCIHLHMHVQDVFPKLLTSPATWSLACWICCQLVYIPRTGTIKRWNHHRGLMTHGSKSHRQHGSIGMSATPSRVLPGLKMAGHMGAERVKIRKLEVCLGCRMPYLPCFATSHEHAVLTAALKHYTPCLGFRHGMLTLMLSGRA